MKRIGTQIPLDEDERSRLLSELTYWQRQIAGENLLENRETLERAFACVWKGQNDSGVRVDTEEESAWPFDGASDQRLRWGDTIYNNYLSLVMLAISSVEVEITCGGDPAGLERARALKLLLNGLIESLGAKGAAQIRAMLHYMLVDSPACAALSVDWARRTTLGVAEISREELISEWAASREALGDSGEQAKILMGEIIRGEREMPDVVRDWLVVSKKLREDDIDDIIEALGDETDDGVVEALVVVGATESPEVKALRYCDDFCVPKVCEDFDYASPWFRSEWVTEAQLMERVAEWDWDEDWARATLEHKGHEFFSEIGTTVVEDVKDLVNLVWCHIAETNESGETVRYCTVLSHADGSACGKRVIRTRRGKWNTVFFRREVLSSNITESRGLAELTAAPQGTAKSIRDMAANNAIVGALPPVKAKGARVRNVLLEPFTVIPMAQNDDVTFMQPPAYPAAGEKAEEKIRNDLYEFLGVSNGQTDVTERRREFMLWFLAQWKEFLILLLESAQDNASDEFIARATASGDTKGVKAADISGQFLMTLKVDPENFDNAKMIQKVNAIAQVLQQIDRKGEVDTSPMVRHIFTMMFPAMAGASFKNPSQLVQDDINAETENFVKIKAGVMPQMDTGGHWNYAARLEFYSNLQQQNPDAIAEMSPRSQEMLSQWIAALEQQNTQFGVNAEVGRTGVPGIQAQ